MKRVLVTGALGFVGGEVVRSLLSDEREVTLLVREDRKEFAKKIFPEVHDVVVLQDLIDDPNGRIFETIFHLATFYTYNNTLEDLPNLISSNITLPTTLADIASTWQSQVSFINVSTFMQHFQGENYAPTCLYAATKKSAEDILYFYESTNSKFSVINLVFPHIYGEGDTRPKLINLLLNAAKFKLPIQLASGRQLMDLVHVSDAVRAVRSAEGMESGRWSIGNTRVYSIRELINTLSEVAGFQLDVTYDESKDRKYDTFEIWDTANRLPGWTTTVDIKQWFTNQLVLRDISS